MTERLPQILSYGGVALLVGMVGAASFVLPGVHASQMQEQLALAATVGVPEAPQPNIPGRLDGQGVGQDRNENRDLQVEYWQELGDGGDGSGAAERLEGRGKGGKGRGKGRERDPDAPVAKLDGDGPMLDPKVNPPMHDGDKAHEPMPMPKAPPISTGPKFVPVPELPEGQPEVLYEGGADPEFDAAAAPPERDPVESPREHPNGWVPLHDLDREARQ
ncbi:MAG: hypothetical protein GY913_32205 [Proteobacteria bacterium]|nr:hypothetical protein [Pseudomonadota bacterium]MCP4921585.1 hypothetical protein [Pseudomonadota bacterium]